MSGLKDYLVDTYDRRTWKEMKESATGRKGPYFPTEEYPDEELYALIAATVERADADEETVIEDFGEFLFWQFSDTYESYFRDEWTALDLIVNIEEFIHERLRARSDTFGTFTPPEIESRRVDDNAVVVEYSSDRGLCPLAKGLLAGIADYYDTSLDITEPRCMHEGADTCRIEVRRNDPASAVASQATESES